MAQFYTIECPKCGNLFSITKGVLMSWDFSKPIPKNLLEETPFNCHNCQHEMCVEDEDFNKYVKNIIFAD